MSQSISGGQPQFAMLHEQRRVLLIHSVGGTRIPHLLRPSYARADHQAVAVHDAGRDPSASSAFDVALRHAHASNVVPEITNLTPGHTTRAHQLATMPTGAGSCG